EINCRCLIGSLGDASISIINLLLNLLTKNFARALYLATHVGCNGFTFCLLVNVVAKPCSITSGLFPSHLYISPGVKMASTIFLVNVYADCSTLLFFLASAKALSTTF